MSVPRHSSRKKGPDMTYFKALCCFTGAMQLSPVRHSLVALQSFTAQPGLRLGKAIVEFVEG